MTPHIGRGHLCVLNQSAPSSVIAGKLNAKNSAYIIGTLSTAALGCLHNKSQPALFDAMVTAPVHKGVINDAGIAFSGHTEYLAELTNTPQVVMMLVGGNMRVALATTHLALKDVPADQVFKATFFQNPNVTDGPFKFVTNGIKYFIYFHYDKTKEAEVYTIKIKSKPPNKFILF